MSHSAPLQVTDLDRRIWEEELEEFVPARVFDVHTHLYRWAFYEDPEKERSPLRAMLGTEWAEATWARADAVDAALMPGREVHRLAFPFPFPLPCGFAASNRFVAEETAVDPQSGALMLVHPEMDPEQVEQTAAQKGFLGFKPYRTYARSGDAAGCRIREFMPEPLIEIAHRRGLLIMMHLSRRDAVADPENLRDLGELCERFPNARWILAHCARSYSAWALDRAAPCLRALPNVWYDTSSVCETDAMLALYDAVGPERVMYGSDDLPVGVLRGKYVTFGYAWAYLGETNHSLGLSHCDPRMTFTRYEQLRAMRRAALRCGLGKEEREALFHDTAARLIEGVRAGARIDQGGQR